MNGLGDFNLRGHASGALAKTKLEELLAMGTVVQLELDVENRDRYGRALAYVRHANVFVNREMARSGMAAVSIYPPNVKQVEVIRAAVDSARASRRNVSSSVRRLGNV